MAIKPRPHELPTTQTRKLTRATLRLTVSTLRKPYPACALLVQNQLMQYGFLEHKQDNDHFSIDLSDDQIERVIQSLLAVCLMTSQQYDSQNRMYLLRGLLDQWMQLADEHSLFAQV